MDKQEWEDL
jgi:magnesium-transporting ATPase (P-type)